MIWIGGAKKRLKNIIDKRINNFQTVETRREQAFKTISQANSEALTDEQLLPIFHFNFPEGSKIPEPSHQQIPDLMMKKLLSRQIDDEIHEQMSSGTARGEYDESGKNFSSD